MPFLQKGNENSNLLYVYDSPNTFGIHGKHKIALDNPTLSVSQLIPRPNRRLSMLWQYLLEVNHNLRCET